MAKTHDIKIWVQWFDAVRKGTKTFEIRKDDRNYETGDKLILNEFRHSVGEYTGRKLEKTIVYISRGTDAEALGIKPGYAVLGIA